MEISNILTHELTAHKGTQEMPEVKRAQSEESQNEGADKMREKAAVDKNEEYKAISKDGDTLQISDKSGTRIKIGNQIKLEDIGIEVPKNATKITDAQLSNYSSGKLKQLLSRGQISKQQYDKAMKKLGH